jgi:serine/threonine protein kinase
LGQGNDGEVFALADEPDNAIKFSVLYAPFGEEPYDIYRQRVLPVIQYVMQTQPYVCVRVFEHQYLGCYSRPMALWQKEQQQFVLHYSIMEKLEPLTQDETKVFHTLISHEDRNVFKDLAPDVVAQKLHGLARGLDFDPAVVTLFLEQLHTMAARRLQERDHQTQLVHRDLEPRNIMKDKTGHYRLIDLDKATLTVKEPNND